MQYLYEHCPAGIAGLFDILKGARPQETIYKSWQYTHGYYSLHLVT